MKQFNVSRGFNSGDVVGTLHLKDGVEVPFGSVFALGGIAKQKHLDENGVDIVDDFELIEVSLLPDSNYTPIVQLSNALEYALKVIEGYAAEIREAGLDKEGFCQGVLFKEAVDDINKRRHGTRDATA